MRRGARSVAVLLAVLVLGGCGLFSDVEDGVGGLYSRAASLDDGTARAYSATVPPVAAVAAVAGEEQPLARTSAGGREYLQYDEDIVRVQPAPGGSTVLVDDYASGYQRWRADLSSVWGPQAPSDDDGK